jgi:alpha-mannosidase
MRYVHMCNHFHCDPIFTCTQAVHIAECVELTRQYMSVLAEEPEYKCILSEIDYLQGWWNIFTEDREDFLRYLKENRIETSGSYSEPNENSVGSEALLRNIVYGQWWHVDTLGATGNVYLPFDVFGHVRQLPQILAKLGFIGTTWTKGSPKHGRGNQGLAIWEAPDGSRIPSRVASYGAVDWATNDQLDGIERLSLKSPDAPEPGKLGADIIFRGSDFTSPQGWITGNANTLRELGLDFSQPSKYFEDVAAEIAERGLNPEVTTREQSLYHAGTALSRTELKTGARLAEQMVVEAETWGAVATLFGESYPEALIDHAWRQILFSQHHDSITGTSNDMSYLDLMSHHREALAEGLKARSGSVSAIAGRVRTDASEGEPVVVFNSLNVDRSNLVMVSPPDDTVTSWEAVTEDGTVLPTETIETRKSDAVQFVAPDVPGVGHRTFWLQPATTGGEDLKVIESDDERVTVETPHAQIIFDPWRGGGIVSLVEKSTGREILRSDSDHPLGDLAALREGPGMEPSWEYRTTGERYFSSTERASVRAEQTPFGWRVTVCHDFPDTDGVIRTYELLNTDSRIDCSVSLLGYSGSRLLGRDRQNHITDPVEKHQERDPEVRDLFGLLFPVGMSGVAPRWSDRFSSRVIRRSVNYLDFRTSQANIESGSGLYSSDQWIAATPDVSVVLTGSTEQRTGFALGMVRVVYPDRPDLRDAADRLVCALGRRGITATPYLDTENNTDDPLQTDQIIALGGPAQNDLVASLDALNGITDSRYIRDVALWGDDGKSVPALVIQADDDASVVADVDRMVSELDNDQIGVPGEAVVSNAVGALDDVGLGLVNQGAIAASCEPDGALFMALQHSAGWCDWATPFYLGHPFVPERKSCVYNYAMLPFAGTWADARLPEQAASFNRPLTGQTEERHTGSLPSNHRYFDIEADAALLSALKPVGHPSASHDGQTMDAAEGIAVRVWNWDQQDSEASVGTWTGITRACAADPAERPGTELSPTDGVVGFHLGANAIETLLIVPSAPSDGARPSSNLPIEPRTHSARWWLESAGGAPIGNLPLSVALRGDLVPGESGTVRVSVANNQTNESFNGTVQLTRPDGWRVSETSIPVEVPAFGGTVVDIEIEVPAGAPGRLQAEMVDGTTTYVDTLTVGEAIDPLVQVELVDGGVELAVANPSQDRLEIRATLVLPIETWAEAENLAQWPVEYLEQVITLDPGGSDRVMIELPDDFAVHAWAYVKLAFAGRAAYHRVPLELLAWAESHAGSVSALDAPRADALLMVTNDANATLSSMISVRTAPPAECSIAPVDGIEKYWTVGPLQGNGGIQSATVRFGVVPADLGTVRSPGEAQLAQWVDGSWQVVPTTFDEENWTLSSEISPETARSGSYWTLAGPTDVVWQANVGTRFFEADPYVADIDGDGQTEVVAGTAGNEIIVFDSQGEVKWKRKFTGWIWPSIRFGCADVDGDGLEEIVVCSNDRTLALLKPDGRLVWRCDDQPFAHKSTPMIADINGDGKLEIVVSIHDNGVWAWDTEGNSLWRTALNPMLMSSPLVTDIDGVAAIYVNLGGKRLVRLDGDGQVVWENIYAEGHATGRRAAVPVVADALDGSRSVLFAGHDGILRRVDMDGNPIWQIDLGAPIMGAPAVLPADGDDKPVVVCANGEGKVAYVGADGALMHEYDLGSVAQGGVVVADVNGDGKPEIVIGSSRMLWTHILDRDGCELVRMPYGSVWEHTPAVAHDMHDGAPLVITGTTDQYVVAVEPVLNND